MVIEVVQEEIDMPIIVEVEGERDDTLRPGDLEEPVIKLQVISDINSVRTIQLKGRHALNPVSMNFKYLNPNLRCEC